MTRALIFDCFGVLVSDALTVLCETLANDNPGAVVHIWSLVGQANRGMISADAASTEIAEEFGLSLEQYRAKISQGELKNQPLLDYIVDLRKTYKTAMLSNIAVGSIGRRFSDEELARYFDLVVVSGEIGVAKPELEAYGITALRLGVKPEECVFVDDRRNYLEGARETGMQTILYEDFDQFKHDLAPLLSNT